MLQAGVSALGAATLLDDRTGNASWVAGSFRPYSLSGGRSALSKIGAVNGVPTLFVDGSPFLITGAQCDVWRGTKQDDNVISFFNGYQKMNATCVGVDILWSKIEMSEGQYDFTFLRWFIDQAEPRGLKLVLQLFGSNVCGKIQEGADPSPYPVFVPGYIKNQPDVYQRVTLAPEAEAAYESPGPPMCPNDPATLIREKLYLRSLATYLRDHDTNRTVILAQIDNEFGCWSWAKPGIDSSTIRCLCNYCNRKWNSGFAGSPYAFMIESFADYTHELSNELTAVYPLPLYLNSPWYSKETTKTFLDRCPHIAVVGMDGVFDPHEPNMLSNNLVGRNLPFASECPTENPKTRFYLDTLPYYMVLGDMGLGQLLWEAPAPHTVVDDPNASERYGRALYPIKNANELIAQFRGSANLAGWYVLKDYETSAVTEVVVREGVELRTVNPGPLELKVGRFSITVMSGDAGIAIAPDDHTLVIATPGGKVVVNGATIAKTENGVYTGTRWKANSDFHITSGDPGTTVGITEPSVVKMTIR